LIQVTLIKQHHIVHCHETAKTSIKAQKNIAVKNPEDRGDIKSK